MALKLSKEDAPGDYAAIGLFKTRKEAEDWYNSALKAGSKNPFQLTVSNTVIGKRYILWWQKQKNAKKSGKGFKGG